MCKPDPAVFRHVLAELDVSAAETLFVDDLEANVEGARSVGIRAHHHVAEDSTVAFLRGCGVPV
jgi:HAD superfamily hydrolase (TIGR01509 family)